MAKTDQTTEKEPVREEREAHPHSETSPRKRGIVRSAVVAFGQFASAVVYAPLVLVRGRRHAESVVVYAAPPSFFLWLLILTGFVGAWAVKSQWLSPEIAGWIYVWVLVYFIVTLLFDLSTHKLLLWIGIFSLIWLLSKYVEHVRNIAVLGFVFEYLASLNPKLDPGTATVLSWILLLPWIGSLFYMVFNGRKQFTPNEIGEFHFGEGSELTDRSGLRFRTNYRDILETVLTFGGGDLLAVDNHQNVIKRWDNIIGLFFSWKDLDRILHQRSVVDEDSDEDDQKYGAAFDDDQCLTPEVQRPLPAVSSHWLFVLCLVGLDYFSTLAYLPSLAVTAAGDLAPLAAFAVVLITLFAALPIYAYIVGRSASGRGVAGLLEQVMPGWRGKILVLTVLGFAAADFVITRSLSTADAAVHLSNNPHGMALIDRLSPAMEALTPWVPAEWLRRLRPFLSRQVLTTLGMTVLTLGFWQLLQRGFTRKILWLAVTLVTIYLIVVGIVVVSGLTYIFAHESALHDWWHAVQNISSRGQIAQHPIVGIATLSFLSFWAFPQLALGLSGFELTMTIAPLVRGGVGNSRDDEAGRIRNTRKLLCTVTAMMSLLLMGSVLVTTLIVPREALTPGGLAEDRALAYLAHGGLLADGEPGSRLNPWFGDIFGNVYDASTISILSLAGASVIVGLRSMLPHYLHRLGMALTWAGQTGPILHLLNLIIVVVTVVFHANISTQQWAYATSVLVLLAGAALAAGVDVWRRLYRLSWRWVVVAPLAICCCFFVAMTAVTALMHPSGVVIALSFVGTIVVTSFISRWRRSTELRFEGFAFSDEAARLRWEAICQREFQVVVPHRPGLISLSDKSRQMQREFRLPADVPLLFVEASLGDPSEFYQQPLIRIDREGELEVVRVSKCASVSHVLASICLALCRPGGRPPEIIFGWSNERPLAANLNFLLLGEGNIPWMVRELVRHAVPDISRQPRIHIG